MDPTVARRSPGIFPSALRALEWASDSCKEKWSLCDLEIIQYPRAVLVKSLVDIDYLQLVSGSGEGQILSNEPKGALYLRSETDRQSKQVVTGFLVPYHPLSIRWCMGYLVPDWMQTHAHTHMVPVRRLADPSPPTLETQELFLIKGLFVFEHEIKLRATVLFMCKNQGDYY